MAVIQDALKMNTTFTEQLHFLEKHFVANRKMISEWFHQQWQMTPPPFYGSIDLRNAGFKIAPIDMNLFPAGFNNLNPAFFSHAVIAAQKGIQNIVREAKKILLIPENHTRNTYYWENIGILKMILVQAGFDIRLGLPRDLMPDAIHLSSGEQLEIAALERTEDRLHLNDFYPDVILLNNDLSSGIPDLLQNLQQIIVPPAKLGWSQRLKSGHFYYYFMVANEFARVLDIDKWLIAPLFRHCGEVDFLQQQGMSCLIANSEILLNELKEKYHHYQIPYEPFLVVKADAGTYGMAVMTVRHLDELKNMNRKQRTKMSTIKGGQPVRNVIIQEGVHSFETFGEEKAVAEPVIYLFGESVIGGFYRVHQNRGVDENLNSPGMRFEPLAFAKPCHSPSEEGHPDSCINRFYLYGIIAQLSMLAAAREMKDL